MSEPHLVVSWNGGTPSSIFFDGFSMKFTIQLLGYHHLWKRLRGLKMWPPHVGRVRSAQWVVRKTCQIPSLCKNQNDKSQVHLWILMIYLWLYFQCFDWAWKKVQQPAAGSLLQQWRSQNGDGCHQRTRSFRVQGEAPTSETMAKNRMWWVKCPRSPKKCVFSLCLYTYIHTDIHTYRHTYIHMILACVCCVCCVCCVSMQLSMSSNADSPRQMTCVKPCARVQQVTLGVFTSLAGEFYSNGHKDLIYHAIFMGKSIISTGPWLQVRKLLVYQAGYARYQSKWANQDLVEEVSNCQKNAQDENSRKECFLDTPSVYIDLGKS